MCTDSYFLDHLANCLEKIPEFSYREGYSWQEELYAYAAFETLCDYIGKNARRMTPLELLESFEADMAEFEAVNNPCADMYRVAHDVVIFVTETLLAT